MATETKHVVLEMTTAPPEVKKGKSVLQLAAEKLDVGQEAPRSPTYKWKDGKLSIEHHLTLYIEDLTAISSAPTADPVQLRNTLDALRFTYLTRIRNTFDSLDHDVCKRLASALLQCMAELEKSWSVSPKLTENAELAFEVFAAFLEDVKEFQMVFEEKEPVELMRGLRIDRHLRSLSEQHRKVALRCLHFITTNFDKYEDWTLLIKPSHLEFVTELYKHYTADPNMTPRPALSHSPSSSELKDSKSEPLPPSASGTSDNKNDAQNQLPKRTRPVLLPPRGSYYDFTEERLLKIFKVDPNNGLSLDEVDQRQMLYGFNEMPRPQKPSIWWMIASQFLDFIVFALVVASVVSYAIGEHVDASVLLSVVFINAAIGFSQEYQAEQAVEALGSLQVPLASVLRDGGKILKIPSRELVPGDIVLLEEGDAVPADLRMIETNQLQVIESLLTGESVAISKQTKAIRQNKSIAVGDRRNMGFMSTVVARGRGKGIVVNTGQTTEIGKISTALSHTHAQSTPLKNKLTRLGKLLVVLSLLGCAIIIGMGLLRGYGSGIVHTGISLAVSVIPEGLLTVVTLTMAMGMKRMASQNAIVKQIPAVETLGSVTTVCSDKTGTLTEGKMKVVEMQADSCFLTFSGSALDPEVGAAVLEGKECDMNRLPSPMQLTIINAALNNNANMMQQSDGSFKLSGDSTEIALAVAAFRAKISKTALENKSGWVRLYEWTFDSDRKRMSVLYAFPAAFIQGGKLFGLVVPPNCSTIMLTKGATESVFATSVDILSMVGDNIQNQPLNEQQIKNQEKVVGKMASQGMRVLAFAFRFVSNEERDEILRIKQLLEHDHDDAKHSDSKQIQIITAPVSSSTSAPPAPAPAPGDALGAAGVGAGAAPAKPNPFLFESKMTFVGFAGIIDPPRKEVPPAIAKCQAAGIRVCMITGDHQSTAVAIAQQIGIFKEGEDRALNEDSLNALSIDQLAALEPFPTVFSRVSPDNKLKIVKALQARNEIVSMTGDGVNDAPALKAANAGVAMGISGTDITRQAASIVLRDDNFTTIVKAIEEGRRIYDNIIKFLAYLLSCNTSEVGLMFLAVACGVQVPFEALAILWSNIFVDVPPSLSLGLESAEPDVMQRKPRDPRGPVLDMRSIIFLLANGLSMCCLSFGNYMFYLRHTSVPLERCRAICFCTLFILQVFQSFMSRSLTFSMFTSSRFFTNKYIFLGNAMALLFTVLAVYIPGLNSELGLAAMEGSDWIGTIVCIIIHVSLNELTKFVLRNYVNY